MMRLLCSLLLVWTTLLAAAPPPSATTLPPEPARVVIVHDAATVETFTTKAGPVRALFDKGLLLWARTNSPVAAWRSIISPKDIVGIKVYSSPGPSSGTRPDVVAALVESLLAAGQPANHIIVWDRVEADLRASGFVALGERYHIIVTNSAATGYDKRNYYESSLLGNLVYGDSEFGQRGDTVGRRSYVSKLVTQQMTKIISVAPLLNHNAAGVAGHLYSVALGSIDNQLRFEGSIERQAVAIPEIYNLPVLADHVVLNITDALICQYVGESTARLQNSIVLGELRFSKDPVALDSLSLEELERQKKVAQVEYQKNTFDLYPNAALLELGVADRGRIRIEYGQ